MRNLLGLGNINREDIPPRIVEEVANLLRTSDFLKVSNNGTCAFPPFGLFVNSSGVRYIL